MSSQKLEVLTVERLVWETGLWLACGRDGAALLPAAVMV